MSAKNIEDRASVLQLGLIVLGLERKLATYEAANTEEGIRIVKNEILVTIDEANEFLAEGLVDTPEEKYLEELTYKHYPDRRRKTDGYTLN